MASKTGEWSYPICSCQAPWGLWCVSGWLCYDCQMAKLHSYVRGDRPPVVCSCVPCALVALSPVFPVMPCVHHIIVRTQLVDQLGIKESRCKTCMISWCFPCGSNTQMTQTLLDRNVPAYVFMDDDDDGRNPLLDRDEL